MRKISYLLLLWIPTAWAADINLDTPRGGWRNTAGEASGFIQQVYYPAASVNSEGHASSTLIKGDIKKHPKDTPAKLNVNGVAMPLLVNEAGQFQRPYAFGSGSNGVEIMSEATRRNVQFYEVSNDKPQSRLRVVLSWDSNGTDLDLHVVSPDGQHVFYGNRVAQNGGALDVDVTTGYGPEIYASPSPFAGVYHVYVNYYGAGSDQQDLTVAQLAIVSQEGTVSEKRQVVQVPMRKSGELTLVKSFSYP